jgi:hypothetical protein
MRFEIGRVWEQGMRIDKVTLAEKFATFGEPFSPRIVGEPAATLNTGNVVGERTVHAPTRI